MSKVGLLPCESLTNLIRFNKVLKRMLTGKWFYIPCLLLLANEGHSQTLVPDFTADYTSGCAPLVVRFRDLTAGGPKYWNWDFGNGTLSNVQYPTVVYSQPGTYTVTLVVRNADGTNGVTKTNYITVNPSPTANFSADITTGCVPVNIHFTDQSVAQGGPIVSWQWDFGDGTTSTAQNPQKTYSQTGFYSVSLTVTSSSGCKSTAGRGRYIRIVSGVTAEFDNSTPTTCHAPFNVDFRNNSSGPGNMTFQWDLGNGSTSTLTNPSTSYAAPGTYNVTLTATSEFGCSGTITKPVTIKGVTTAIKVPDTVCQSQKVFFVDSASETPRKIYWDFGNGDHAINIGDSTVYYTPGSYTVLLANTYATCIDSVYKNIYVRPSPLIDFTVSDSVACKPPLTVTFKDASPAPIVNWQWDFGDGSTGSGQTTTHTYNSTGTFDVHVLFTDNKGCEGRIVKTGAVKIKPPTAKLVNVPDGGCLPFTYKPVTSIDAIDSVASYLWDFGDGGTSTDAAPTYVYNSSGKFTVKLTITTRGGCSQTITVPNAVLTAVQPVAKFSMSASDICASEEVSFTDQSTGFPAVDKWQWDFGDGATSNLQNPTHKFRDTGTLVVKLTAFNNSFCPATSLGQAIHVKPPIPKFKYDITCGSMTVQFTDLSATDPSYGPISYLWQFGDPANSTSTQQNPVFTFPALGSYNVILTVTNGSCTDTAINTVQMVNEMANFNIGPKVCRNTPITIQSTNNPLVIAKYEWAFDGGTYTTGSKSVTTSFATMGSHSISLRITDVNGCVTFKTVSVTATGPVSNFKAALPGGCKNASIPFTDLTTPAGSIQRWTFDFGDGQTQTFTQAPFAHVYKDTGEFIPTLIVQDTMGCADTFKLADTIFISTPQAWFYADYTTICPSSNLHFTDSSSGYGLSYAWDFGDGHTSTDQNPVYAYGGNDAQYTVQLTITDRTGCSNSVTRTNYITTKKPKPAFDIRDTVTICPPIETKFTFHGSDYESFEWDFGDGFTSSLPNPTHFYNSYGTFTPKLNLTGYGGCIESASATVHVYNPGSVTTLTYSPLEACNEITVNFSLTTPPNLHFSFYFGDGSFDTSMALTYTHYYGSPAYYTPYVFYTDNQDCQVAVGGGNSIKVIGADPFFNVDQKKFCDSGTVNLTDYTIGNDPVVNRVWDFGDGSTTSNNNPTHKYQQPGTYTVSQSVTTQAGCTKTISDIVKVYRTPDPSIQGDSVACLNAPLTLHAVLAVPDTAINYQWDLGNGNPLSMQDITYNFKNSGYYTAHLKATNQLGCSDTASKVLYVPPTPDITIQNNPVIPVSTGITLPVTYGPDIATYTWTPAKYLSCTDCPTPYAKPQFTTTYNIKVKDIYGCTNSGDITVTVVCSGLNYFIPNTFSPNGDGVNDVFAPRGTGLTRVNGMRIFNRWGELVFEKMNFQANDRSPTGGWDGTYKGKPASADVYVYIIEFVCENAQIVPVKGNVTLVR